MRDGRDAGGSPPLSVFVKLPGVAGEIGLALLLFVLVRTHLGLAGALAGGGAIVAPVVAAGGWPNMVQALGRLARHDMLSANAANAWWIVGYLLRARYAAHDMGAWAALTAPAKILDIQRVIDLGYPNPRAIGIVLTIGAAAWALWTAYRSTIHNLQSAIRN